MGSGFGCDLAHPFRTRVPESRVQPHRIDLENGVGGDNFAAFDGSFLCGAENGRSSLIPNFVLLTAPGS